MNVAEPAIPHVTVAAEMVYRWPAQACPLSAYLRPGDGVLDLGANVGEYTRDFAAHVGEHGFVLAVEPDPHTAMVCRALAQPFPQVHVLPAAVGPHAGVVALHYDAQNRRRNSLFRGNLTHDCERVAMVPMLTLDQLAAGVPLLRAIKVDIQGAEGAMLAGATLTLRRTDLVWWVELWPAGLRRGGSSMEQVVQVFSEAGWMPEGSTWQTVLANGAVKPAGAMNVLLQHRSPQIGSTGGAHEV